MQAVVGRIAVMTDCRDDLEAVGASRADGAMESP